MIYQIKEQVRVLNEDGFSTEKDLQRFCETNLELLLGMLFFGWFTVFCRQIAALEADRIQEQVVHLQLAAEGADAVDEPLESRVASDR